jgi:hypothetical protein
MAAGSVYADSGLSDLCREKKLKKGVIGSFVLLVLAVLGFSGCDAVLSPSSGDGGVFSQSGSGNSGKLTITGIDASLYGTYNVYISEYSESYYSSSYAAYSGSVSIKEL